MTLFFRLFPTWLRQPFKRVGWLLYLYRQLTFGRRWRALSGGSLGLRRFARDYHQQQKTMVSNEPLAELWVLVLAQHHSEQRGHKDALAETLLQLQTQAVPYYVDNGDEAALFHVLHEAQQRYTWGCVLTAGDHLYDAQWLRQVLSTHSADAVYTDFWLPHRRRLQPYFPAPWEAEYAQQMHFIGNACCWRLSSLAITPSRLTLLRRGEMTTLVADIAQETGRIAHQPGFGFRLGRAMRPRLQPAPTKSPTAHPPVTLIIPTRDNGALLQRCIDSIVSLTDYPDYRILVVDNGTTDLDARKVLRHLQTRPHIRVLAYDKPFNYAEINNWAIGQIDSPYVAFLNDDVEVIQQGWLSTMMAWAQRDDSGAVGAKLLYPNGKVQHAGIGTGIFGGATHLYKYMRSTAEGPLGELAVTHACSAVTAACLVMQRSKFTQAGGFNQQDLAVAFNDVDLCLTLLEQGFTNWVCNNVQLIHHESVSRGEDTSGDKQQRFAQEKAYMDMRWQLSQRPDPNLNPAIRQWLSVR